MPAETIHGDNGKIDVRIAWGATTQCVQVSSQRPDEGFEFVMTMVNRWLIEAGMEAINCTKLRQRLPREKQPYFDGWHATFEGRAKVNRMIAVLRRARDHAFGKDE